jgi:type I restriction enzyme S subunit
MSKWEIFKIGDVCKTSSGGTPLKLNNDYYDNGDIPWLVSGEVCQKNILNNKNYITQKGLENSSAKLFPVNTVLVAMYGATAGQVGILRFESATNQAICGILPNKRIIPEFLYYALLFKKSELIAQATGNAQPNISQIKIKNTKIPVPPIEEQKRIVEILDKAFEGIAQAEANTRRNLINARELFDSYLNSALIGFVLQETPQILADITELIIDCEHKTAPTQEMGYPSIRTPNIGKGYLTLDNVYRVSEETYQEWTRRAKPQANDLILAREAPAGNVGIVPEGEKVCLGQRTVLIRPKKTINSQYLAFYLLHPEMQKQLLSKSSGATVQHVNMKDIRSLKISYFPSMEVQQKLAEALQSIQSRSKQLETIYQRKLEAIAELKQSILEKAFTGQLSQ